MKKLVTIQDNQITKPKVAKKKPSSGGSKVIEISLANTGIIKKKKNDLKRGKFTKQPEANAPEQGKARNSYSPNMLNWRERSASNPALSDSLPTIGEGFSRPHSASPGTRRKSSSGPHPHHYLHPEQHLDPDLAKSGMVRTRSSSLTKLIELLRPRTPPSPHHFENPLRSIDIRSGGRRSASSSKPNTRGKRTGESRSGKALKWSKANWELISNRDNERRDNDYPIELGNDKASDKKKIDVIHTPVAKFRIDLLPLFMGEKKTSISLADINERMRNCTFNMELDNELLSPLQKLLYAFLTKF
jgi:hypothetical protein